MTIGVFTDTYYPQICGIDTSVRILKKGLRERGHKVIVFTTTDPGAKKIAPNVVRLPSLPFPFLKSRRVSTMYPPKLKRKIKQFKLDIIHTQTEFSMGLFGKATARALDIPFLHTYHTMYEDYTHYIAGGRLCTPGMARRYSREFCNWADAVVTPSKKSYDRLIEYGVLKPIHLIPTGMDFSRFGRGIYSENELQSARLDLGLNQTDPVIVTIGRVAKEKGVDVIIKAMPSILEQIPDAKYVCIGDGPYISELVSLSKSLGIGESILFAGPRLWTDIGKYFQIGDLFVSGSTSETQGITYIEAMAAQTAVVAKRDECLEGILSHGETGMFFDTEDDLVKSVCALLSDPEERKRLAQNAYENIQPLSADVFARDMESLYIEMINNHK